MSFIGGTQPEFHALSGAEVREIIIREVARKLEESGEFRELFAFPQVDWDWNLTMHAYDRDDQVISLNSSGSIRNKEAGKKIVLEYERPFVAVPDEVRAEVGLPLIETTRANGVTFDAPVKPAGPPRRRPAAEATPIQVAVGQNVAPAPPSDAPPEVGAVDFNRGIDVKRRAAGK